MTTNETLGRLLRDCIIKAHQEMPLYYINDKEAFEQHRIKQMDVAAELFAARLGLPEMQVFINECADHHTFREYRISPGLHARAIELKAALKKAEVTNAQ